MSLALDAAAVLAARRVLLDRCNEIKRRLDPMPDAAMEPAALLALAGTMTAQAATIRRHAQALAGALDRLAHDCRQAAEQGKEAADAGR